MSDLNKYGEIEDGGCPHCGNPIKPDWVACPECGELLESLRPKPPEAPIQNKTKDTKALFCEVKQDFSEYQRYANSERMAHGNSLAGSLAYGVALDKYRDKYFPGRVSDWSEAAELGCKEAQYLLATCYFGGARGVVQCRATALSWLRKAADNGLFEAKGYLKMLEDLDPEK